MTRLCDVALCRGEILPIFGTAPEVYRGYTYFENYDIIFAKITPCMENGKIAIVQNLKNGIGFGSTEFHVIRLNNDLLDRTLCFYYLIQNEFRDVASRHMKGTAGQLRVPVSYLENTSFRLPPLPEQRRIVSKIESIFAKIDALDTHIKSTLQSLDMLKQSTLKLAFEGNLVSQDPKDEPADKLLEQIQQSHSRWKPNV